MQLVRLADAPPYSAPKHLDVRSLRLQGIENSGVNFCSVGLSYYAPGGRAEMAAGQQEKIYVVLSGEISIELATGVRRVMRQFDSCLIEANEGREVRNDSGSEAIMLVISPPAKF